MTGKKLPSFEDLVKMQKPTEPPPFEQLKPAKKVKGDKNHPKAVEAAKNKKPKKVKGANKHVNKAQDIFEFEKTHRSGHAMFFRHIRVPDEKNVNSDHYPLPGPKGGATILVDLVDDDRFIFSFSICNLEENDPYIKDEARRMCQERFTKGQTITLTQQTKGLSCFENVSEAIHNYFYGHSDGPQLRVNSTSITRDSLATLRRYIKRYGDKQTPRHRKSDRSWPFKTDGEKKHHVI